MYAMNGRGRIRSVRTAKWFLSVLVLAVLTLLSGVGVAALLEKAGGSGRWVVWGNIGESFGALNSIFSGFALAALVVTFWIQFQEMRIQRSDLVDQRDIVERSQTELRRNAEASLRLLHLEIIKLSINDESLANVWPTFTPGLPFEKNRQYLYANVIFQYLALGNSLGHAGDAEIQANLRYMFTSSIMRDYWRAAAGARSTLIPGTAAYEFAGMADETCREYEAVLASVRQARTDTSSNRQRSVSEWEELDRGALDADT